jgi:hypothetical protein
VRQNLTNVIVPPVRDDTNYGGVRLGRTGVMATSVRQMFRLLAQYQEQGDGGLSNRQIDAGVRKYAVEVVRLRYPIALVGRFRNQVAANETSMQLRYCTVL